MNNKDADFEHDYISPDTARKQIIAIGDINRIPPDVGIFDNPVRCFRINQQWWSIVAGMVHWLADVAAWQDAQDDRYFAILEIQRFMQGVECGEMILRQNPLNDCQLQQSFDSGETWSLAFDYSLCLAPLAAQIATLFQNSQTEQIGAGFDPNTTTVSDSYTTQELQNLAICTQVRNDVLRENMSH